MGNSHEYVNQHESFTLDGTSESKISNFYNNRSILITGASGFIGKVLIEKLLRSCTGLRHIFVLIRAKRQKQPHERLEELIKAPLFDWVREEKLDDKIVLIEGDITLRNFGLSRENLARVTCEVSVIFHSAATVKFDEPVKDSVDINIIGTRNLVDLCRQIPQLASLVHVSTAYANCDLGKIDEHVYPVKLDPEKIITMSEWLDHETLQALKFKLLGDKPNTYTYTKSLAEYLLVKTARDLPVVICRPSIVVASWRDPFPGWIDNVNGPTGVLLATTKGLVRSMYGQSSYIADIIPVDTVINLVVSLGWFANAYHNYKNPLDLADPTDNHSTVESLGVPTSNDREEIDRRSNSSDRNSDSDSEQVDVDSDAERKVSSEPKKVHMEGLKLIDEGYGSSARSPDSRSSASNFSTSSSCRIDESDQAYEIEETDQDVVSFMARKRLTEKDNANMEAKFKQFNADMKARVLAKNLPEELADVPVFHCTSGTDKPINWGKVQFLVLYVLTIFPSISTLRYPGGSFTHLKYLDNLKKFFLHYIPAYTIDLLTRIKGGKPMLVKVYQKLDQASKVLAAFTMNQWTFEDTNRRFLMNQLMSDKDRALFDFDISELDWLEFFKGYVMGVRSFLLKEPASNLEQARRNLSYVYYRNLSLQVAGLAIVTYFGQKFILS